MQEQPKTGSDITIRVLADDEHALVAGLVAGADESDNNYPVRALGEEMVGESEREMPENRVIFGLFAGGALAAVGCGTVEEDGRGCISRVYAASALRGMGNGRRLVQHVESYLRGDGCRTAYLYCWSPMTGTQRFWMKMGYARMAVTAHRHEDLFGGVIRCEKPL